MTESSGISFCGVLTIVFIVLKLLGKVGWSWWWVVSPLWIPLAFWGVVVVGILLVAAIVGLVAMFS